MKIKTIASAMLVAGLSILTIACSQTSVEETKLRTEIAQKIMIDLRYYCEEETRAAYCRKPLTQLPESIAKVISNSNIGGIILFASGSGYLLPPIQRVLASHVENSAHPLFSSTLSYFSYWE